MRPVIFLDIDGVVNPYKTSLQPWQPIADLHKTKAREKDWPGIEDLGEKMINQFWNGFDHAACKRIHDLQKEFDAEIIITSSWRVYYNLDQLRSIFKLFDIEIQGLLPMGFPRSDIILNYVRNHHIQHWIALDDMDMERSLGYHFIRTDSSFSQADFEKARRRLKA